MLRAFQWDLARQTERLDWLMAQLPRYADWGYHELYLHLEDAVEYPSLPKVARRDAYTHREMGRLVSAAERVGIRVVPIVNLLGHTQYLIKVPELRDLNELRAPDGSALERGQICPVHPGTLDVARRLIRDVAPFCTAGKVHVGLDESFHLGKHPLSRREISRIGRAAHFARYVRRLRAIAAEHSLKVGMWADMLYFLPGAVRLLPTDIAAYEWYYYGFQRRPRVELFNFRESDLGDRLRRRGIEYWGCPMNGAFRFEPHPHFTDRLENIRAWWRRCHQLNASGFLVTSWEPNRLAQELTTVIDAAAASLWLDGEHLSNAQMLARGFARVFGAGNGTRGSRRSAITDRAAAAAAQVALAADKFPFSGYPRWEINQRWDVVSRRESLTPYCAEQRHFEALLARRDVRQWPVPLRGSIELRWYFAVRDVFVREVQRQGGDRQAAATARGFRAALTVGRRAARLVWRRTRDPDTHGPNEQIVEEDAARFAALRRREPVLGPSWQLCYRVHNFAPAVQLVAVEQRNSAGVWAPCQACHTIEFQNRSARRRGRITREHAAPVAWDGNDRHFPQLRFVLRGLGQVRIDEVVLTDGSRQYLGSWAGRTMGRPAPPAGFPVLDWQRIQAQAGIRFPRQ